MMQDHKAVFLQASGSILLATLIALIAWPTWLSAAMPQWMLLVVLYWVMVLPERFGVGFACIVGLFFDCVTGSLLGQHAFSFIFVAYCALKIRMPLRHLPMWQQVIVISVFSLINLLMQCIIMSFVNDQYFVYTTWLSVLTSALCWPFIVFLLHRFQKQREHYIL